MLTKLLNFKCKWGEWENKELDRILLGLALKKVSLRIKIKLLALILNEIKMSFFIIKRKLEGKQRNKCQKVPYEQRYSMYLSYKLTKYLIYVNSLKWVDKIIVINSLFIINELSFKFYNNFMIYIY